MDDETAVQSRTERWRAELCVSVCLFSTHNSHALSCTHAHMHTLHVCALLTMLCWWTSRGTESQEVRLLPNARLKKKVLRCHAGDRIKHKRAHKALEECGVTSLIQPCLWINLSLFFISHFKLYHMCDLCSSGVDSNNACFSFCSGCSKRKTSGKNRERIEEKKSTVVGWLWCSYFFSQLWVCS